MPCWELFDAPGAGYRDKVLGDGAARGRRGRRAQGWDAFLGEDGASSA